MPRFRRRGVSECRQKAAGDYRGTEVVSPPFLGSQRFAMGVTDPLGIAAFESETISGAHASRSAGSAATGLVDWWRSLLWEPLTLRLYGRLW